MERIFPAPEAHGEIVGADHVAGGLVSVCIHYPPGQLPSLIARQADLSQTGLHFELQFVAIANRQAAE